MWCTAVVALSLVAAVLTIDILGVSYSFDEDFHRTFTGKKCALRSEWILVDYDSIGVQAPYESSKAIRAASQSCATSFPIIQIPGSSLELYVFLRTVETKSGVVIQMFDDHDVLLVKYGYNSTSKGFVSGWSQITLPVEGNGIGYINLIGYSGDNEIVLVDSLRYIPNIPQIEETDEDTRLFMAHREESDVRTDLIEKEDENVDNIIENVGNVSENVDGRSEYVDITTVYVDNNLEIDGEGSGDPIIDPAEPDENNSLGPWAVTLISVAAVTGLGVVGVGVYHLGLIKGLTVNPPFFDVEPARAVTIPRVRGVRESPIERIGRTWDD